jgi:UDP-2,3-diacylglucosamine hydrolase
MAERPYVIVSDIHLGAVPESTERAFRDFLDWVGGHASGLLINGDLFDFWFEYRSVIPRQHFRVLAALTDLVESGVPVTFLGGNHDAWTGSVLSEDVGMEIAAEPLERTIAGRRAMVVHGDGVGEGDLPYRILRKVLRSRAAEWGFRRLHPDTGARIADWASSTEGRVNGERAMEAERSRAAHIEAWARAELERRPELDLIVAGHAHRPSVVEVSPGRYYLNSGDWVHSFTYAELRDGEPPTIERWEMG